MGWSQTQDSEEKVNKLIYNSKVHRCCSGKRFVVSGVQVPNSQLHNFFSHWISRVYAQWKPALLTVFCSTVQWRLKPFYNSTTSTGKRRDDRKQVSLLSPSALSQTAGTQDKSHPSNTQNTLTRTEEREGKSNGRERVVVQHRRTQGPWQLWSFALSIHLIDFFFLLRSKICFFFLTSPLCCSLIFCWTLHFFIEMSKKHAKGSFLCKMWVKFQKNYTHSSFKCEW